MVEKRIIFIITINLLLLTSCKKIEENHKLKKCAIPKDIEFSVSFPDTVYVNQSCEGIVDYKSVLDTIITTFGNKEKNRHTRFFLKLQMVLITTL